MADQREIFAPGAVSGRRTTGRDKILAILADLESMYERPQRGSFVSCGERQSSLELMQFPHLHAANLPSWETRKELFDAIVKCLI